MKTLLQGALLVDGTGAPATEADVLIEDNEIVAVGRIEATPDQTVDLSGLVLAPGFIDIHTHYDAQVFWDPDFSPSAWHGVTTVLMGNCGFGIAPARPEHRRTLVQTLENVEGMSADALEAGIRWNFETFPEFLDAISSDGLRLNAACLVPHSVLRLYVLGEEASARAAEPHEVDTMRRLLEEALAAGGFGFSTSSFPAHQGAGGRPVPSRLASRPEVDTLVGVLGGMSGGLLECAFGPDLNFERMARLSELAGAPATWAALFTGFGSYGSSLQGCEPLALPVAEFLDYTAGLGGQVWPQVSSRPLVMQLTLADPPPPLSGLASFQEVLSRPRPERAALYATTTWRDAARAEVDSVWDADRWHRLTIQETADDSLRDVTLGQAAADQGRHPFDVMLDLVLAENLETRFCAIQMNYHDDEVAFLLNDPRTLLGASDAGAHASQLCDACFSTHLLGHWVRDRAAVPLEKAVWRLTGQPAAVLGIEGRGQIRPGFLADLVAFDLETVGPGPLERVWDLPAGGDRLIARSTGIEHVWVNGTPIRSGGQDLPATRPGRLVRSKG